MLAPLYNGTKHAELVQAAHEEGLTAIFEYCAPDNRIVVHYDAAQLVLTAMRNKRSGVYESYTKVCDWGARFGVSTVALMDANGLSLPEFVDHVWRMDGAEGAVIRFDDGTLTKLKGEWYVQLHKLLSYFEYEKDIAWLILSEKEDDLIGILQEDKRKRLEKYRDGLRASLVLLRKELEYWRDHILHEKMERKAFALCKNGPHHIVKHIIFKNWDNLNAIKIMPALIEGALANTTRGAKWEAFKSGNGIDLIWTETYIE